MARKYTKIELLSDEIFRLNEHGKIYFGQPTLHTYRHHKECVIYVRSSTNVIRWCWAIGWLRR